MIRRVVVGLAVVASMIGPGPVGSARAADAKQPPDLTGQWRLDPKRSDSVQRPDGERGARWGGGGRMGRGGMGGPGMGGPGDMGGGGGMRRGRGEGGAPPSGEAEGAEGAGTRPARLPDLMHVTQTASVVSFEDSNGTVLREITTLGGAKDTLSHAPKAQVLAGEWKGDQLEVQRSGRGGMKMSETVTLEEKGELLVIHTKIEGSGDRPAREFKRAYRRVKD